MRNVDDPEWLAYERPLVAKSKAGNQRAYHSIYDAFAETLLSVFTLMLRNRADADDVVAGTFHTGWEKIATFISERSIFYWLRKIGEHRAIDVTRQVKTVTPEEDEEWDKLTEPIKLDVEGMIDLSRARAKVAGVIQQLENPQYARALTLFFFEDLSREECAAALGISLNAFYLLLPHALAAFRALWTKK